MDNHELILRLAKLDWLESQAMLFVILKQQSEETVEMVFKLHYASNKNPEIAKLREQIRTLVERIRETDKL